MTRTKLIFSKFNYYILIKNPSIIIKFVYVHSEIFYTSDLILFNRGVA